MGGESHPLSVLKVAVPTSGGGSGSADAGPDNVEPFFLHRPGDPAAKKGVAFFTNIS
jgi:hypothetical protein